MCGLADDGSHFVRDIAIGDVRLTCHDDLLRVAKIPVVLNSDRSDALVLIQLPDEIEEGGDGTPSEGRRGRVRRQRFEWRRANHLIVEDR